MLVDLDGRIQPAVGTQDHWAMFRDFSGQPDLFDPLLVEIVRLVRDAVTANANRPFIDSRQACGEALSSLTSWWHGEFPRHFSRFPNGAERGIFGMCLWNYLASINDQVWCFSGIEDSHGYGQSATQYWRTRILGASMA